MLTVVVVAGRAPGTTRGDDDLRRRGVAHGRGVGRSHGRLAGAGGHAGHDVPRRAGAFNEVLRTHLDKYSGGREHRHIALAN